MSKNRECAAFLGVYISENILASTFDHIEQMPYGNRGYDFICSGGYKIDVKSACRSPREPYADRWNFYINHNHIADYFLCLAFDDRNALNPEHVWLIPGNDINDHSGISIAETRLDKWTRYEQPIDKVITCCNILRDEHEPNI